VYLRICTIGIVIIRSQRWKRRKTAAVSQLRATKTGVSFRMILQEDLILHYPENHPSQKD
jgi:hypothetical protein